MAPVFLSKRSAIELSLDVERSFGLVSSQNLHAERVRMLEAINTLHRLTEAEKETGTEGANVVSGFEVKGMGVGKGCRLLLAPTRSKTSGKRQTNWGARRQKGRTTW